MFSKPLKKHMFHRRLSVVLATLLLSVYSLTGGPVAALASGSYQAAVTADNSAAGATTGLTVSTTVPANTNVLSQVVVAIPAGYTLKSVLPQTIGTLQLSVPSAGISESWSVDNGQTITAYSGNTNTYTYTITLNATAKTLTVAAASGTRTVFPDALNMTFTLDSGILTNPATAGTYTWNLQGKDYYGTAVSLSGITTSVSAGGGGAAGAGGAGTLPQPSAQGSLVLNPTSAQLQAAQAGATLAADNSSPLTVQAADGVTLSLPVHALAQAVSLTIEMGQVTAAPKDVNVQPLDPVATERQFGPAGTVFANPVSITFPYSGLDLKGASAQNLAIYRWDETLQDWIKVGGVVDPLRKVVSVPVYHFSTYALMLDNHPLPERLSGADRFATANAVADQGWPDGAPDVVLANAYAFPDALAGSPLAYKLNAPILLTDAGTLTPGTWAEIQKLKAARVTILGGEGAVSSAITSFLQGQGLVVARYGGSDRFQTAALIAQALGTTGQAVLVSGEDAHFPDALAISSWAAYHGAPILFSTGDSLPAATTTTLQAMSPATLVVAGGEGAVTPAALAAAQQVLPQNASIRRYAGPDRYSTATAIASAGDLGMNLSRVYLATGLGFADALVAGNLAAHEEAPIVLTEQNTPAATFTFLQMFEGSGAIHTVIPVGAIH